LWFAGAQVSGTVIIFVLSLFFGAGSLLSRRDGMVLFLAAGGLVAWYYTDTAAYALAITISISMMGGLITVAKAYHCDRLAWRPAWLMVRLRQRAKRKNAPQFPARRLYC